MPKSHISPSNSRRYWRAHVQALEKSGLSRAEYCRQHQLSYHALTYWLGKLRRPGTATPVLVPVPADRGVPGIRPLTGGAASGVSIRLDNRITIEVDRQFSPDVLSQVMAVMEGR